MLRGNAEILTHADLADDYRSSMASRAVRTGTFTTPKTFSSAPMAAAQGITGRPAMRREIVCRKRFLT